MRSTRPDSGAFPEGSARAERSGRLQPGPVKHSRHSQPVEPVLPTIPAVGTEVTFGIASIFYWRVDLTANERYVDGVSDYNR
jgi:hypothetical protein